MNFSIFHTTTFLHILSILTLGSFASSQQKLTAYLPSDQELSIVDELRQIAKKYNNLPVNDSIFKELKVHVRKILKENKEDSNAIFRYMDENFKGATLINIKGKIAFDLALTSTESIFKKALFESKKNNDLDNQERAHLGLGDYYQINGNYVEAESEFAKVATLYEQQDKLFQLAHLYINLSNNALSNYQKKKAKEYSDKMLPILEKYHESKVLRRIYYNNLCTFYEYNGDYNKSLMYSDSLLPLCSPNVIDNYIYNRALLLLYQGFHRKAAILIDQTIASYKEKNKISYLGNCYLVSAECYRKMAVYDTAMIQCNTAWQYLSKSKSRLCHLRAEIAKIKFAMGNTTAGKNDGLEVNVCFNETSERGDFYQLFSKFSWESTYYENVNKLDDAINSLDSCHALATEKGIKDMIPSILNQKGDLFLKQNKLPEAEQELMQALASAEEIGLLTERASSLLLLAELELAKRNYKIAEEYISQSLNQAQAIEYVEIMERVLQISIEISEKQGAFEKAYAQQAKLTVLKDSLRSYVVNNIVLKYNTELEVEQFKEEGIALKAANQEQEVKINKSRRIIIACISLLVIVLAIALLQNQSIKSRVRNEFRKEISRDVHDDIGVILVNLVRTVNLVTMDEGLAPKDKAVLARISELSNSAMLSFRDILWKTDVKPITVGYFQDIITDFTHNKFGAFFQEGLIEFSISNSDTERIMDNEIAYHCLMIYKGVMQNILKHNNECEVKIDWKFSRESIIFFVKNRTNNKVTRLSSNKSRGIDYMNERVKLLNGEINFDTSGDSYSVEVFIPC